MKNTLSLILIISLTLLLSCASEKNDDVMCTMEYRILTVAIKDSQSKLVILSSYFVRKTSTGEILDYSAEDSLYKINGTYIICTDSKMGMTSKSGTEFEFHGFSDTQTS